MTEKEELNEARKMLSYRLAACEDSAAKVHHLPASSTDVRDAIDKHNGSILALQAAFTAYKEALDSYATSGPDEENTDESA